jgi:hypothetical protein
MQPNHSGADQTGAAPTPPSEPQREYLVFLRWLAERDRLEHRPLGAPGGPYAPARRAPPTATWGGRYC